MHALTLCAMFYSTTDVGAEVSLAQCLDNYFLLLLLLLNDKELVVTSGREVLGHGLRSSLLDTSPPVNAQCNNCPVLKIPLQQAFTCQLQG